MKTEIQLTDKQGNKLESVYSLPEGNSQFLEALDKVTIIDVLNGEYVNDENGNPVLLIKSEL